MREGRVGAVYVGVVLFVPKAAVGCLGIGSQGRGMIAQGSIWAKELTGGGGQ